MCVHATGVLGSSDSRQGPVTDYCGNELSSFIKSGKFLDNLRDHSVIKMGSAAFSYLMYDGYNLTSVLSKRTE
jgi:hypothetical protein